MAKSMDDAFNLILLLDLAGSTLLLGLTSYLTLVVENYVLSSSKNKQ